MDGRARTTYKHRKPFERWEAIIQGHHEGYIESTEFERNQKLLAANAYGKLQAQPNLAAAAARCYPAFCSVETVAVDWWWPTQDTTAHRCTGASGPIRC